MFVPLTLISFPSVPGSLFLRYRRYTTPATVSSTAAATKLELTMIAICLVLPGFTVVSEERPVTAKMLSAEMVVVVEMKLVVLAVVVGVVGRTENREMKAYNESQQERGFRCRTTVDCHRTAVSYHYQRGRGGEGGVHGGSGTPL